MSIQTTGHLAMTYCGKSLPLQILHSRAGHYIGTFDDEACAPCSRESLEYFPTKEKAQQALETGSWTQKVTP